MAVRHRISKDPSYGRGNFTGSTPHNSGESAPTSDRNQSHRRAVYVNIYESEFCNIVGQAVRAGFIETGGQAYGLFTHTGNPVVMYTTGAGPKSVQRYSIFEQESTFVKRISDYLYKVFGLQVVARHHSHHEHDLPTLSSQDKHSNYMFASRNGYETLCEFLVTFDKTRKSTSYSDHSPNYAGIHCNAFQKGKERVHLGRADPPFDSARQTGDFSKTIHPRVHAFMFLGANKGNSPIPCPIRIIPGKSPIRELINKRCHILELKQFYNYPLSRISYNAYKSPPHHPLPKRIYNQCLQLPSPITDSTKIIQREGLIMLLLPLPDKGNLLIIFREEKKYRISSVYFATNCENTKKIPITNDVLPHGPYTNVATVYKMASACISPTISLRNNKFKRI